MIELYIVDIEHESLVIDKFKDKLNCNFDDHLNAGHSLVISSLVITQSG